MTSSSEPFASGEAVIVSAAGDAAEIKAARTSGALVLQIEFLDAEISPWAGARLPGTAQGCGHRPGNEPRHIEIRTDVQGRYFAAIADLLLRSNGVQALRLVGAMPEPFVSSMQTFALQRGYQVLSSADAAGRADGIVNRTAFSSLEERVAPAHAALILIDLQNDFCAPAGAAGRLGQSMEMIESAVERSKNLLSAARQAGVFVVHVRAEYGELFRSAGSPHRYLVQGRREPAVWTESAADLSSARIPNGPAEVCLPGSWGGEFVSGIEPTQEEPVIAKHRFSAFVDTGLDPLLRANRIRSVVLAGVTTNCCVESTARDAVMRDYHLVVANDCVAVKDHLRDLHDATLESLGLYFGLVRPSAEIISAWSEARRVASY